MTTLALQHSPIPLFLKAAVFLLASLLSSHADAQTNRWLPTEQRLAGGIVLIDISDHFEPGSQAYFGNQRVKISVDGGQAIAVIGIPLHASAGHSELRLLDNQSGAARTSKKITFILDKADYPTERLTIADNNKVSPDPASLKRIQAESGAIKGALRNWQNQSVDFRKMVLPVTGRLSSEFGYRRIINGHSRKPHSGIDLAAPTGTKVIAPAGGVITGLGDYFFNGNTLFIDHGEGLISMFCHLSETLVGVGDQVTQGQLVAAVGSSGRATGPHLHWSLSLNDARINPLLFTSEVEPNRR
ncbi:MAG: M23 family metallopeptidase [Immundisolibacteraceae bacterium]|nr:M23 family metallopeptidase [Immundisolibacteraceae bacterium]